MKQFSIEELKRDLQALDAADQLTGNVSHEVNRLKSMGSGELMKKATGMLLGGNISLKGLGLPENIFEQLEQLSKLNDVARKKYRATVKARINELESIEDAEVVEHD